MRYIIIRYLKRTPRLFFLIRRFYYWSHRRLYFWSQKIFFFRRYQKKRSHRVADYRRLIDDYLRNKINPDYKEISEKVEKEIHKINKFELKLTSKWWLLFVRSIDSKNGFSDINKYINELHNETLSLPFNQNSSFALLELYALLLEYGLYSIGCIIRSKSAKLVLKEGINKSSNKNILTRYLSAAFEERRQAELKDSLEEIIALNSDYDEIHVLNLFFNKIFFKINSEKLHKERYIENFFSDLINGKRVAIVGPAQNDLNNGKEIDSFDIIVRFNYKGENIDAKNYGSRTDISYFNGANTWDLQNKYKKLQINDLKAAVYKVSVIENYLNCKCNRRMFLPLEHCMLDSSPNALQNMLADLLLYQPQEIKVFSIDMRLTNKRDISYGIMGESFWDRYYPKASHDPYSNYLFIEYLYSNNLISVDSKLKKILDLGIVDYMMQLQEVYKNKAIAS